MHKEARKNRVHQFKKLSTALLSAGFIFTGFFLLWVATLKLPDVSNFQARIVAESTRFFDREGKTLLFNTYENIRRTAVPLEDMSPFLKQATIAIEDSEFYEHIGIKPTAILRAVLVNATSLSFSQGGSTITQQVVKNSLLTQEKSIPRKIKEWVLALKLERVLTKDQILEIYLNESPYGGNIYGAEEASLNFFGKSSKDLTLPEAAYLAALPQAPSYYSPYGNHKDDLEKRKNLVLAKMLENGMISKEEHDDAKNRIVEWKPLVRSSALAPHFTFYLKDYLAEKYGEHVLSQGGLNIITTIDAELQKKAEEIVKKYALENESKFDAENAGLLAIDPKTGQILAMVGSRDFFDKEIDGNFNITLAKRQPGSSFKPFVYATALKKGYTDKTILFDVKTEFSARCTPDSKPLYSGANCYSPQNFDNIFRGPVTLRDALAQSMNVPAVKTLYLVGLNSAIQTAEEMGITSLNDPERLGLTLVLGGGEVSLMELVGAYGGFANDGIRNQTTGILKITDKDGKTLEEYEENKKSVIDYNVARTISSILSDNRARSPAFGERSSLYFDGRAVAAKTGTTNDYRDAWVVGYTDAIVAGAWAGNNDNRPMQKKVAGQIVAPMWHEFMVFALSKYIGQEFPLPDPIQNEESLPPLLRGILPRENGNLHSILYWIDKDNPRGGKPSNPQNDPQFVNWEYGVLAWIQNGGVPMENYNFEDEASVGGVLNSTDLINNFPSGTRPFSSPITFSVNSNFGGNEIKRVSVSINNRNILNLANAPFYISFSPRDIRSFISEENTIKVIATDSTGRDYSDEKKLYIDLNR